MACVGDQQHVFILVCETHFWVGELLLRSKIYICMIGFGSFFFLQKRSLVESIRIWCMVDVEV